MKHLLRLALATGLALAGCGRDGPRPNLLLVSVDTLRADQLACYGGPPSLGKAICALGATGTRYEWAFSTAPTTSPAVASLLTSLWVPEHRVTQNLKTALADDYVTVAELLRDAGYTTAGIVSNPMLHGRRNLQQGFDHYDHQMTRRELNRLGFAERDARATTDAALTWAREHAHEPWFLWLHYQDPHGPYTAPDGAPRRDPRGAPRLPLLENDSGQGGIPRYQALPGLRSLAAYRARYRGEIRYLDGQIARLVAGLDALGSPPGILLTADHGEALGEDGYYFAHGHSTGLDQIRVPLLWRPPGEPGEARTVATPVSLVDVAPTLLRAAGLATPEAFRGRALQEVAEGERSLFAEASRQAAVIRGTRYYARDRTPGATTTAEGRPWGGQNPELPPRTARLDGGPALPRYADAREAAPLERELARYIAEHPIRRSEEHADVPAELREQLRALGYGQD